MAKCTATSKRTGNQCRRDAIAGGTVCQMHGGQFPQVKAAAQRRLAQANLEGEIGRLLAELDDAPMPDLLAGLELAVRHCGQMVAVLRWLVGGRDPLAAGRDGAVPDPVVGMYGEWLDRYTRATKLALDAGIDERRVRLSEATSGVLFDAIGDALAALQLTSDQQQTFRTTLAARLRAIESTEPHLGEPDA